MEYSHMIPPIDKAYYEMSHKEIRLYNEWYIETLGQRIADLEEYVQNCEGFEEWKADYSPESLLQLGSWFVSEYEMRDLTEEEIEESKERNRFTRAGITVQLDVPTKQMTGITYLKSLDIAAYLGEVFRHQYPFLQWGYQFTAKQTMGYGKPQLYHFDCNGMCVEDLTYVYAVKIEDGTRGGEGLKIIYDIWEKCIIYPEGWPEVKEYDFIYKGRKKKLTPKATKNKE